MLIGIAGPPGVGKHDLAGYLVQEYGFVRLATPTKKTHMPQAWIKKASYILAGGYDNDPSPLVIADVGCNTVAEFVRRRGLLLHLRRPGIPVAAHPDTGEIVHTEIDDVRVSNDCPPTQFFAKVDALMVMIKKWGLCGA